MRTLNLKDKLANQHPYHELVKKIIHIDKLDYTSVKKNLNFLTHKIIRQRNGLLQAIHNGRA